MVAAMAAHAYGVRENGDEAVSWRDVASKMRK